MKLLPETEDKIKGPLPLFSGKLATAFLRPFLGHEEAMSHRDSAAQVFYRLGWTEKAEKLAKENLSKLPSDNRADILSRILLTSKNCTVKDYYDFSVKHNETNKKHKNTLNIKNLSPNKVLSVGMMCDFFHGQIAQYTIIPQLRRHNPENVKFFLYDSGKINDGRFYPTQTYKNVRHLNDKELTKLVQQDEVDILIEMNGPLRPNNRLGVLRRRAAPIQVSWYNLCATTGIKEVDRVITDEVSVPAVQQKFFTETLLHLPGKATGGWKLEGDPQITPPPFLHNQFFTFGCFGDSFKINIDVIKTWSKILNGAPKSKLFIKNELLDRSATRLFLIHNFAMNGVNPSRLIFEGSTPYRHYCTRYQDIDIALDTFPYSNGSTTMNALWQGVPTLTIAGPDWRSRMSMSIMQNSKLDLFIVDDEQSYISRAIEIANKPDMLIALRENMREHLLKNSRYFQIGEYTQDFETGMRMMWLDYLNSPKQQS